MNSLRAGMDVSQDSHRQEVSVVCGARMQLGRGSLLETDDVSAVRLSEVERAPRAVKVERDGVRPPHRLEHLLELVKLDLAVTVLVKDAEGDLKAGMPVSVAR